MLGCVRVTIFSSRDIAYKKPYGAAKISDNVYFQIKVPYTMNPKKAFICMEYSTDESPCRPEMDEIHVDLQAVRTYEFNFKLPDHPCIIWYNFLLETNDGTVYLNRGNRGGEAIVESSSGNKWQQTVFQPDCNSENSEWFGHGVTYHIFIDRFNRSCVPSEDAKYNAKRIIHKNWNELPVFMPDEKGEVKNNDFFGGNLKGIEEKLPYLASLSVSTIYLSPMFEAESNHRYDTADYMNIDPIIGTEQDFKDLCSNAEKYGIRIILDGVFNHTGCNSRYFNRRGFYDCVGAYQSQNSPYYNWYSFDEWPNKYSSWWGIYTLPQVNEKNEQYRNFIINSDDSVINHWIKAGAAGWRLDVADELPDDFISAMSSTAKKQKPSAVMIGEVWEDASCKISYDCYRQYILNGALDGVTNYPLRNAILAFLRGGSAEDFKETIENIMENYPHHVFFSLMNHIGTHDTPRILTALGCTQDFSSCDKSFRADYYLSSVEKFTAIKRLMLASFIQFTMPGSPTIYYGDEAGIEGFEDPLNRKTYPWGHEEQRLVNWYRKLGKLRKDYNILSEGNLSFEYASGSLLIYSRRLADGTSAVMAINRSECEMKFDIRAKGESVTDLISGKEYEIINRNAKINIEPLSCMLLI